MNQGFNMPDNIMELLRRLNINPYELKGISTPDEMAQYLLNSGKVNQQQVNQAKQIWNQQFRR